MTTRSRTRRCAVAALTTALLLSACGGDGGSDDTSDPSGESGQPGVVVSAAEVEAAVVESTTAAPGNDVGATSEPTVTEPSDVATSAPAQTTTTAPAPATTLPATTVAPQTTAAPTSAPTGVPAGFRPIADDSGEVRTNVPADWLQVDGAPDGELRQLAAAPDLPGFLAGYTQTGMILITGAAATPDSWMDGLATTLGIAETDGCTVSDTSDYSDGVYNGTEHVLSCGDPATVTHLIGGRNSGGDLFFLLAIVRPAADVDVRDQIVQSFFID